MPPAPGPAAVSELLAGQPYKLVARLGSGGISTVYVVEHDILLKRFALKVLHPFRAKSASLVERARIEAQAVAKLRHPNVVEIVDFWLGPQGQPCMVLELLEGHTLGAELKRHTRLPPEQAIVIARQTLSALQAAHDIGVVHRDIKPENVFLHAPPGLAPYVKVLDFGLARVLPEATGAPAPMAVPTDTGVVVGTLRYMSPEGARGERVGPAADIFSVGLLLYVMLTGNAPLAPELTHVDPPSRFVDLTAFPGLEALVLRATAMAQEARPASAAQFRHELKRVLAYARGR